MDKLTIPATVINPSSILDPVMKAQQTQIAVEQQRVGRIEKGIGEIASGMKQIKLNGVMKDQEAVLKMMDEIQRTQVDDYINAPDGMLRPEQKVKHTNQLAQLRSIAEQSQRDRQLADRARSTVLRNTKQWDMDKVQSIFKEFEEAPIGERVLDLSPAIKMPETDLWGALTKNIDFKPTQVITDEGTSYDWSGLDDYIKVQIENNPTVKESYLDYVDSGADPNQFIKSFGDNYKKQFQQKLDFKDKDKKEDKTPVLQWSDNIVGEYGNDARPLPGGVASSSTLESADLKTISHTFDYEGITMKADADIESIEVRDGEAYLNLSYSPVAGETVKEKVPYSKFKNKLENSTWWKKGGFDKAVKDKIKGFVSSKSGGIGAGGSIPVQSTIDAETVKAYRSYVDNPDTAIILTAIASQETRGSENPDEQDGVEIVNGTHKGDKAYGRFQIMPNNVVPWMKEHVGKTVNKGYKPTQDEQIKIAAGEFDKHFKNLSFIEDEKERVMLAAVRWYGNMDGKAYPTKISDISKKGDATLGKSPWDYANGVWENYQQAKGISGDGQRTASSSRQITEGSPL